jgi:hypothetical protein
MVGIGTIKTRCSREVLTTPINSQVKPFHWKRWLLADRGPGGIRPQIMALSSGNGWAIGVRKINSSNYGYFTKCSIITAQYPFDTGKGKNIPPFTEITIL